MNPAIYQAAATRLAINAQQSPIIDDNMNAYEADPNKIPKTDRYGDVPFYGRYLPRQDDFQPDPRYFNSVSPESLKYWESVLERCGESVRIFENTDGGRDVFALGSVIIKSNHLTAYPQGKKARRDYSYADANEVESVALARKVIVDVKVPEIYFASKVRMFLATIYKIVCIFQC